MSTPAHSHRRSALGRAVLAAIATVGSLTGAVAGIVTAPGTAAAASYAVTGYYPVSGTPGGGGFCITPGGTAPAGAYSVSGQTNSGASATVMWFSYQYGPDGTAFTNGAGNTVTFGGPFVGVAAVGGTGYGGAALSPLADTVTGEQIANDNVLGINDYDHTDTDTAYVNALTAFANDYPGPWYIAASQQAGPYTVGNTYSATATIKAANGAVVPVYGFSIPIVNASGVTVPSSVTAENGTVTFSFTPTAASFSFSAASGNMVAASSTVYWNNSPGYQKVTVPGAGSYQTTWYASAAALSVSTSALQPSATIGQTPLQDSVTVTNLPSGTFTLVSNIVGPVTPNTNAQGDQTCQGINWASPPSSAKVIPGGSQTITGDGTYTNPPTPIVITSAEGTGCYGWAWGIENSSGGLVTYGVANNAETVLELPQPHFNFVNIAIQKEDTDPAYVNPDVAGITYEIFSSTGTRVGTMTSNSSGYAEATSLNIPAGTYDIVEETVPSGSGLVVNSTPIPVQITTADITQSTVQTVTAPPEVDPVTPGGISITKVDSATNDPLSGASFTVVNDQTGAQVAGPGPGGTFVSGSNGSVADPSGALTNLEPGPYTVTEVGAPANHSVQVSPDHVTVVGGQTQSLVFSDKTVVQLTTKATADANLANAQTAGISDTAQFTGSAGAGGTLTFAAWGPYSTLTAAESSTCGVPTTSGPSASLALPSTPTPAFTSKSVTVNGSGTYQMPGSFVPTSVGYYTWQVIYGGDTNNDPAKLCGGSGEVSTVVDIATTATKIADISNPTLAAAQSADSATVAIPSDMTGSLVFAAYGPFSSVSSASLGTASCSTPAFTSAAVTVSKSGTYQMSGGFVPTKTGIYDWVERFMPTGAASPIEAGLCGTTSEQTYVISLTTQGSLGGQAAGTVNGGTGITDTANVSGVLPAGASLSSTLYSLSDASCTSPLRAALPMSPNTSDGPGYWSTSPVLMPAGTYQWVAQITSASGATIAQGPCDDASETSNVATADSGGGGNSHGPTIISADVPVTG